MILCVAFDPSAPAPLDGIRVIDLSRLDVQARGIVVEAPDEGAGTVLMHNVIPRLSETPGRLRRRAPELGQHTSEILATIACDPGRIAQLAARGRRLIVAAITWPSGCSRPRTAIRG